jgi:hypothetical protein
MRVPQGPELRDAWRALDGKTRRLIDRAITRGQPLEDSRYAAIAVGRATEALRSESLVILVLSGIILVVLPLALALSFGLGVFQVIQTPTVWVSLGLWLVIVLPLYGLRRRRLEQAEKANRDVLEKLTKNPGRPA